MKNFWVLPTAGVFAILAGGTSFAADPMELEPSVSIDPARYDWTGAYVGISGGLVDPNLGIGFGATNFGFGDSGFLVGGTAGYNHQFGSFVLGLEGDISYADVNGATGDIYGFFGGNVTTAEADYIATVRARVGYAFDRVLVFATGGAAFTEIDYSTTAGTFSKSLTGYAVGGGLEYGFTENLSAKIEYLYADFGSSLTAQFPGNVNTNVDMNLVRVGLNYRF